jgi:DNA primase
LVTVKEGKTDVYDKFRHRIMFPIRNGEGTIVAFAGRLVPRSLGEGGAMKNDQQPKYLNSPETAIYHKSDVLYNFSAAKEAIREKQSVLIVEGYMDVIALHQAGERNAVAVCGTALSPRQATMLKRCAQTAVLCFDSDMAGLEATRRNAIPVLQEEMTFRVMDLQTHKDADEFFRQDPEGLRAAIASPADGIVFLIEKAESSHNVDVPEGRKSFLRELAPVLQALPLVTDREWYAKKIATHLGVTMESVLTDLSRSPRHVPVSPAADPLIPPAGVAKRRSLLLGILLNHPEWLSDCIHEIKLDMFASELEKNVYSMLSSSYNQQVQFDRTLEWLGEAERGEVAIWMLQAEDEYADRSEDFLRKEASTLARLIVAESVAQRKRATLDNLRSLEKSDPEAHWKLLQEFTKNR